MITQEFRYLKPNRELRELNILSCIGEEKRLSQHRLAVRAGISSAMTHNYMKDFVRRKLVEMKGTTNRTITYFLTDKGRGYRTRLLLETSTEIIQLYTFTKMEFIKKLEAFSAQGIRNVALFGAAETGEVVCRAAQEIPLHIVAVVDNDTEKIGRPFYGEFVVRPPCLLETLDIDGVIITSFANQEAIYQQVSHLEKEGVRVLRLGPAS